jgi:hypothetical protein
MLFDATLSSDPDMPDGPDRGIARYEWSIVQRPDDSTTTLTPDNTAPSPNLFLDLHGRYVVELRVFDEEGLESCEPVRFRVETVTDEDIHIALVWQTPGDDDEHDEFGTDIDLHLLHPRGEWNSEEWDCHWQNPLPDWGAPGDRDDPRLDIDDTNGLGPENINLSNAEPILYEVGAHYYSDNGDGPSFVTVRIYIDGRLAFEHLDRSVRDRQFWQVAVIDGETFQVRGVDIITREIP